MKRTSASASAAFTLVELLVVMAIIATLCGLIFPAMISAPENARRLKAKTNAVNLTVAINQYNVEYGHFPDLGITGADTFVAADNYRLMNILRGRDVAKNPRKIPFFSYKDASGHSRLRDGFDSSGNLLDPWGNQYKIKYDTDYDHDIMVYGETVSMDSVVWSVGRDGVEVPNYTMLKGSDDVVTWR